ncbi:MAG: hypothetical protein Q8N77_01435 [Nanoarchaeota archaeon]|nr:hypothetical protein [Nanoarchaeota archaeon]
MSCNVSKKTIFVLFVVTILMLSALLYLKIFPSEKELEPYPKEMEKAVEHWCADIKDRYYRAICIRTLKEDPGCSNNFDAKGYCVAATFSRDALRGIESVCKKYSDPITGYICVAKTIAYRDVEAAREYCSQKIEDEDWRYFCYADVTSKVDLEGGEKLCADIPGSDMMHFCYGLMASKKNNFKGDIAAIQEHCSKISDKFPSKGACKGWGYVEKT